MFSCDAESNPSPRFTWFRLNDDDEGGVRVGEGRDLVLVASSVTRARYQCQVGAGGDTVRSEVASLSLLTGPSIVADKVRLVIADIEYEQ